MDTPITKSQRREEKTRKTRSHKTDGKSVFVIQREIGKRAQAVGKVPK